MPCDFPGLPTLGARTPLSGPDFPTGLPLCCRLVSSFVRSSPPVHPALTPSALSLSGVNRPEPNRLGP